ncbi:hypothetical protein [Streptomyces sp. NPDC016845]|uniref:hypothetical protein n=1 Tax=Streptomyces sp. NPDC016845 TaxID=3364972 RepID=UPI00378970D1
MTPHPTPPSADSRRASGSSRGCYACAGEAGFAGLPPREHIASDPHRRGTPEPGSPPYRPTA